MRPEPSRVRFPLPLALCLSSALSLTLGGCAVDVFADDYGDPPAGETYDPEEGGWSSGSTSTTSSGGETDTEMTGDGDGDPGPPECDDAYKRCEQLFTLPDMGYASVDLIGDFSASGWTTGAPMTNDGGTWTTTTTIPWDTQVLYKFRINGDESFIADPNNPAQVEDGFGGFNSVLEATTCGDDYICESDNIGDFDWRDAIIYFVFVDRFQNGDQSNDDPIGVELGADWQGGDWAGVSQKIAEGYFTDLGINCLWLSVPMDNPNESGIGTDGYQYSAYHGYWPQNLDQTEEHFGSLEELQNLVDLAHQNDIKVIVDYAMNHVHASAPVYQQNPEWFWPNDNGQGGDCVCGSGCGWDGDEGRRCWFTPYLPDYNFQDAGARDFSVGNAVQWIFDTGIDGYRLDAVKHIEDAWLTDLRARVSAEVETMTQEHFYMVGETFTGDRDLIKYYVNPSMLDGQFDFPLRMEIAHKVMMRQGSMSELASFMDSNDAFYGAGIMSTFIGNHDIPRVIHLAEDTPRWDNQWADGKDQAWENKPGLPQNSAPFERTALGFTLILTTPGAPLIYYGDEVGLPGAGDPDNRRFMQWEGYSAGQDFLYDHVSTLNAIRLEHAPLRRGQRSTLSSDADTMVYAMTDAGSTLYVAVNRSDSSRSASGLPGGDYQDLLSGQQVSGPAIDLPARTSMVLLPQ